MKYRLLFFLTLAATSLLLFACNDKLNITITNPNVEQQVHEQPLATAQPRFSWNYGTDRQSDEENPTTESEFLQARCFISLTQERN